jgi:hypothetical protein
VLFRLCLLACLALGLQAEDLWIAIKSGPFEVFTTGSERAAREKLIYLEQFREALRILIGKDEIGLVWPINVVIFKNPKDAPALNGHFVLGREARMEIAPDKGDFSLETLQALARLLVYENTAGLPKSMETALIDLLSTMRTDGAHITLGDPVPQAERSHDWALLHLIISKPDYLDRAHILLTDLQQSGDFDAACRNAFQKSGAQINQEADDYLKAGNFATVSVSGHAINVRFKKPEQLDKQDVLALKADLLMAAGSPDAVKAYAFGGTRGDEGLGLLALKAQNRDAARDLFDHAVGAGTLDARPWLEDGRMEADQKTARADFERAARLNPRWAEPYIEMADQEFDPGKRAELLKKAAALDPRNVQLWQTLASAEKAARNFTEMQKAWGGAERAAATEQERARIHQARLQQDSEQVDLEKSDRKRAAEEKAEDLARVKAQSEAAIHAAEAEARKKLNPEGAPLPANAVWLDELKGNASLDGEFLRLDCLAGDQARMVIKASDGKTVQLMMRNPSQISITGGDKTVSCGAQSGTPHVHVEYDAKPDAKMRTTGDVASIEFR